MEIGFNNDVEYRGKTFHIQTEDHGENDHRVSTQLFRSGAILDSKTVSYSHLIEGITDEEARKAKIRKVMVGAHRALYKKLHSGAYDHVFGDAPAPAAPAAAEPVDVEAFEPAQERMPSAATVLEEDGKVTFTFDHGEEVDLAALSAQLNDVDVYPDGDGTMDLFSMGEDTPAFAPAAPAAVTPAPVDVKVAYRATGQRAFQGLIEPEPSLEVISMVRDFLRTS